MTGPPPLPIDDLTLEALRALAIDYGTVSVPPPPGAAVLQDDSKNWATNVHANHLVKIIRGAGAGQTRAILSNSDRLLTLNQAWAVSPNQTSVYVIMGLDAAQIIRDVLGAGADVDIVSEFDKLKEALRTLTEASVDTGVADDTSTVNFLDDSSKNWPPSPGGFENLIIEITEGAGVGQFAKIASNTATRITFVNPMPVAPDSTSKYRIGFFGKMAGDITHWGGVALTGRDISLDLARLDIALSAFRDALRGAGTKDFSTLEADAESILARIDITLSALKAVGAETPRTLSNLYDQLATTLARNISQIGGIAQTGANWTPFLQNLDTALSTRASEATLAAQLNITVSALRDAITAAAPNAKTLNDLYTATGLVYAILGNNLPRNIAQVGGVAQTGADWTPLLQRLDVALSTRATETTLAKLMPTTATKYAVALTLGDTQYSQALPANTKKFRIHLRDYATFRLAYETGKVAGSVDPYETIPAGSEKYEDGLNLSALTVYLASPVAGKTAEIEAWS